MRIAFIKPNYPDESRVALLPDDAEHLVGNGIELIIEAGFGDSMGIPDKHYQAAGAILANRADCYAEKYVFNLKLTQESDYEFLRPAHVLVGWTHPFGSGQEFYEKVAGPMGITLIDIDSVVPRIFRGLEPPKPADFFPPHMFWRNSYNAGIASVRIGLPFVEADSSKEIDVCVLGSGSVAQGAFHELSRQGYFPRMFYRRTMPIFYDTINRYSIIVNGIEIDTPNRHIIDKHHLRLILENALIIDAAADAGNAIYGTQYQALSTPLGVTEGRRYTLVNNAPTIMTAEASNAISRVVANDIVPALAHVIGDIE